MWPFNKKKKEIDLLLKKQIEEIVSRSIKDMLPGVFADDYLKNGVTRKIIKRAKNDI